MTTIRQRPTGVAATVDVNGRGTVQAASGGGVVLAGSPSMEGLNPLELFDAALAGCLALSVRIAARTLGLSARLGPVTVEVRGTKAADAPSRIARQVCRFAIAGDLTADERARLIAEAHRICTIGNSLADGVEIEDGDALDG